MDFKDFGLPKFWLPILNVLLPVLLFFSFALTQAATSTDYCGAINTGLNPEKGNCKNGAVLVGDTIYTGNLWTWSCRYGATYYNCSTNTVCGNGVLDAGEQCDIYKLNNQTCLGLGYASGTLRCNAGCAFDTSGCFSKAAPPTAPPASPLVDFPLSPTTGNSATISNPCPTCKKDIDWGKMTSLSSQSKWDEELNSRLGLQASVTIFCNWPYSNSLIKVEPELPKDSRYYFCWKCRRLYSDNTIDESPVCCAPRGGDTGVDELVSSSDSGPTYGSYVPGCGTAAACYQ